MNNTNDNNTKRGRPGRKKGGKNKNKSAFDPETMTMPTSNNSPAPPLQIWSDASLQEYFPNLYKEFMNNSNRMLEILKSMGDELPKDGICLEILDADFGEKLQPFREEDKPNIPFDNDSTINEFAIFMINMFSACETGSCGGDAWVSKLSMYII